MAKRHDMPGVPGLVLLNLSGVYCALGRWDEAFSAAEESLAIRRKLGDLVGVSAPLRVLAIFHCLRGVTGDSVRCVDQALALNRQVGDLVGEHLNLLTRCEANMRHGSHADALADVEMAHGLARRRGDRYAEALALYQKSRVLDEIGDRAEAMQLRAESEAVRATVRTRRDPLLESLLRPGEASVSG